MNDAGRIGFVLKGNYDNNVTYEFLDVVFFGNSSYVAKKLTVGNEPSDRSEFWQALTKSMSLSDVTPEEIGALPTTGGVLNGIVKISNVETQSDIGFLVENDANKIALICGKPSGNAGLYSYKYAKYLLQMSTNGEVRLNGISEKSEKDSDGNVIKETYAKKSIYGDGTISRGREDGTKIGENSFVFTDSWGEASGDTSAVLACNSGRATKTHSVAIGGANNLADGNYSSVIGGNFNRAYKVDSAIIGGNGGYANGEASVIIGGYYGKTDNFGSACVGKYNKEMTSGGKYNNQIGDVFVVGNGTSSSVRSNALRVTYAGNVMGTKAFQSSGADYAEYVRPWADGNIYGEDRVGYFVTIKDGLLYKADDGDYILGITSGNPSVVGNADEDYYWKYERDNFNRIIMEDAPEMKIKTEIVRTSVQKMETKIEYIQPNDEDWEPEYDAEGNPVPNEFPYESGVFDDKGKPVMEEIEDIRPVKDKQTGEYIMEETGKIIKNARMKLTKDYDPSLQGSYIPRAERQEWDCVGMVGVLPVRDDGTCVPGQFCKCGKDGIATFAEERNSDTYMVLERIAYNVVNAILK